MLEIRPWDLLDAPFIVKMRNRKELNRWFRQDHDLTLDEQVLFMTHNPNYRGYIITEDFDPVGIVALNVEELCVVAPLKYHFQAVKMIEEKERPARMWGEVFRENPALMVYLFQNGFNPKGLYYDRYFKNGEYVDVILIEKICAS